MAFILGMILGMNSDRLVFHGFYVRILWQVDLAYVDYSFRNLSLSKMKKYIGLLEIRMPKVENQKNKIR